MVQRMPKARKSPGRPTREQRPTDPNCPWLGSREMALALGISAKTLLKSDIPRVQVGGCFKFHRDVVDRFLMRQMLRDQEAGQ